MSDVQLQTLMYDGVNSGGVHEFKLIAHAPHRCHRTVTYRILIIDTKSCYSDLVPVPALAMTSMQGKVKAPTPIPWDAFCSLMERVYVPSVHLPSRSLTLRILFSRSATRWTACRALCAFQLLCMCQDNSITFGLSKCGEAYVSSRCGTINIHNASMTDIDG